MAWGSAVHRTSAATSYASISSAVGTSLKYKNRLRGLNELLRATQKRQISEGEGKRRRIKGRGKGRMIYVERTTNKPGVVS